jgi:hypothetical protein
MIDKIMVVLQNYTDSLDIKSGSCNQTCVTSSCERTEAIDIKAEDISDVQKEQDPGPTINAEPEVGCISVCLFLGTFHRCEEFPIVLPVSICWCVCMPFLLNRYFVESSLKYV